MISLEDELTVVRDAISCWYLFVVLVQLLSCYCNVSGIC